MNGGWCIGQRECSIRSAICSSGDSDGDSQSTATRQSAFNRGSRIIDAYISAQLPRNQHLERRDKRRADDGDHCPTFSITAGCCHVRTAAA